MTDRDWQLIALAFIAAVAVVFGLGLVIAGGAS